jgi:SAM-dependent methyltransferase
VPDDLRRCARESLVFNAPLSEERAADLLERLVVAPGGHVLDLGCGHAELLLRLVAALDRARARAAALRLLDRVDFVEADVTGLGDRGDVVLCVGSAHAWGGVEPALAALAGHLQPGGLLLYGDGFWAAEAADEARALFGELPAGLDGLADAAAHAGFRALHADVSSQAEWDAFEAGWRDGLVRTGRPEAVALARDRRREYEQAYRGVLGFAWLVLAQER